jgi:hypothetical protein
MNKSKANGKHKAAATEDSRKTRIEGVAAIGTAFYNSAINVPLLVESARHRSASFPW